MNGIIGKKIGMTSLFGERGDIRAVTAIEVGPCYVTQIKTEDSDGYTAVQIGFGEEKRLNSPERGHLQKSGHSLKYLREFRCNDIDAVQVGQRIDVSIYEPGDKVDITGTSKGKGFAGVVKRHHFSGGPKTHGQSDRHRAPGSIGGTTFPGRVFKGKRMAGQMGNKQVTTKRIEVVRADTATNLLIVRGAVPGAKGSLVIIKKTVARA